MKPDVKAAAKIMGREPLNEIGSCFDTAGMHFLAAGFPEDSKLCHGIGIANIPGQEGKLMGHAWIEYYDKKRKVTAAFDTTWGISTPADHYRKQLNLSYCVVYTKREAFANWSKTDMPGPWDPKIFAITEAKDKK
jgi:hypothetical protein